MSFPLAAYAQGTSAASISVLSLPNPLRFAVVAALALVVAVGLGAFVTGPKLYKMARIKGWLPGASVTRAVVTQKGVDQPQGRQLEGHDHQG